MTVNRSRLAGHRILIVEDNFNIATGMVRLFKAQGIEVVGPAATVADALATIATAERIDGAVLDVNLRGKLVWPVVDALRSKGVPLVFMTGYDDEVVSPPYRDIPCVRKPIALERVIDAIGMRSTNVVSTS
jgi:DNA-binding response OmpR family regulator